MHRSNMRNITANRRVGDYNGDNIISMRGTLGKPEWPRSARTIVVTQMVFKSKYEECAHMKRVMEEIANSL